ncbi:hypothetical protein BaRGS_00029386 [Batillaria attramentaria]|uniref:adenosine deaminase n=1 Tax=Batillaria attramentaria TaxID=370345 RepID=A0ABD0JXA9_9CAEN
MARTSPTSTFSLWSCCCTLFLLSATLPPAHPMPVYYQRERDALIAAEQKLRIGGTGSSLSGQEQLVDKVLLQEKRRMVEAARLHGADYPGRSDFLERSAMARTVQNTSTAYSIIKNMPKGGVLHVHDEAITSIDWLVKNVTYRDNCYICVTRDFSTKFHFFDTPPTDPDCTWRPVSDVRAEYGNDEEFDRLLHSNITLVTEDPAKAYPDIDAVWKEFMDYFDKVEGLMLYAPVFEDYLYEGLKQFRQDNVQYLEIRGLLLPVYELDGSTHDKEWVLDVYKRVNDKFVKDYPDFTGFRFIMTSLRLKDRPSMLEDIKEAMRLYQRDPDFMVGFDLVGQEDPLQPLTYYLDDLLYPSLQNPPVNLPYFFHAGETDWQETASDYNLVDALLLNTRRIGHGFALHKHPYLLEEVKNRTICVEVNPISNQVLKLVDDLRNHPAASLIADNFPLVISSDDPGAWEAAPLTDDFYVSFMALTGEEAGLATLKQLAKNSILYSALNHVDKAKALGSWEQKWNTFITTTVRDLIPGRDDVVAG